MARTFTVKGRIEAEDAASSTIAGVQSSFAGLSGELVKGVAAITGVTLGFTELKKVLTDSLAAAQAQETALVALNSALRLSGPAAQAQGAALEAQAASLSHVTVNSRAATESAQALLATFGVQATQLQEATQAAEDLSARLGIDLNTAAREVGGTIQGFTRGLDKVVPGLKEMSDEALKAGKGITAVADAMKGGAIEAAQTLAGKLAILSNSYDELEAAVARATHTTGAEGTLATNLAAIFDTLTQAIETTGKATIDYNSELAAMIAQIDAAVRTVTVLADIQDHSTRAFSENATAMSDMAETAKRLGVTLSNDVNSQLEANEAATRRVLAISIATTQQWNDQQAVLKALAEEHDKLVGALEDQTTAQLRLKAATQGANDAMRTQIQTVEELARVNSSIDAGGLSLAGRIQFGGENLFGGSSVNGGNFTNIDGSPRRF